MAGLLLLALAATTYVALGLLFRVGSWGIRPADLLTNEEGLAVGSTAPQVAAERGAKEFHLSFGESWTFLLFGLRDCKPCAQLLRVALKHPATAWMRLVYVGDTDNVDLPEHLAAKWEAFQLHNSLAARKQWRAPVSPFFFVIDPENRIAAKGIANEAEHLDRLFSIRPPSAIGSEGGSFYESDSI